MTRMFLALLIFLATAAFSHAAPSHIILLSVGVNRDAIVNDYPDIFALEAAQINNSLIQNRVCPVTAKLFYSKEATRKNLLSGLKWLEKTADEDCLVIIYIGAHGGTDSLGYSCTMADGWVYAREIQSTLDRLPCQVLLIVDTCHAEAFMDKWDNHNTFVIAACRRDELACVWYIAIPFADALSGADKDGNGKIDTEELYEYLVLHVDPSQHVVASNYRFKVEIMIAAPDRKRAGMYFLLWMLLYVVHKRIIPNSDASSI